MLQDLREYESYLDLEDEWQAPPPSKEGGEEAGEEGNAAGAQFASFTGTKVRMLTQLQRCQARAARGAALEAT